MSVIVMKCVVDPDVADLAVTETPLFLGRIESAAAALMAADHAWAVHTKHLFPLHRIDRPEISLFALYAIFSTVKLS